MTNSWQEQLAGLASAALLQELELYPKAGLVSRVDSGSHQDMDYDTFRESVTVLENYWRQMVELGQLNVPFPDLVQAGKAAEDSMLQATMGINTHRGAIFILGIIVAATAGLYRHRREFSNLPRFIREYWGADILIHRTQSGSHGSLVRQLYPALAGDILKIAAEGFLPIFNDYLPLLKNLYPLYGNDAYLEVFYRIMAGLPDNNLLYRGGADGVKFAQIAATHFLQGGGISTEGWLLQLENLHRQFVSRNLSPGGCADMLAATIFLFNAEKLLWG